MALKNILVLAWLWNKVAIVNTWYLEVANLFFFICFCAGLGGASPKTYDIIVLAKK